MDEMNITSAQYGTDSNGDNVSIKAIIDGIEWFVPLITGNKEYDEIMRQVAAGTLTIADAD